MHSSVSPGLLLITSGVFCFFFKLLYPSILIGSFLYCLFFLLKFSLCSSTLFPNSGGLLITNALNSYLVSYFCQMVKSLPAMLETQVDPWVRKIPWRRKWKPTPVSLLGKSHGWRSLVCYNPWGHKELDMIERLILFMLSVLLVPPHPSPGAFSGSFN